MKNEISKNCYVLIVLLVLPYFAFTQNIPEEKELINQEMVWYRYQNRIVFSEKWEWVSHIDDRRFLHYGHRQHTWVFRTQPFYNISEKLSVSQGYVFFLQSPHDPESESTLMVPEHRPFQEVVINNDLGKVVIRHRYRLEERFFRNSDEFQLLPGYHFNWRLRYQFQAQRRLFKWKDDLSVHFRIAEEIMVNFGKEIVLNTFDQSRFSAAFYINLSKAFDLELGYSHWFQQREDGFTFFNRNIYRITLVQTIDLKKKDGG